ncbi:hypothetical protein N2152v2_005063 [Parachlorella kessleri]
MVVGSILAVLNNAPLETARFLRGVDSVANSVAAGAGTGALLFKLHGGHPVKGAAVCAALGGAASWAGRKVDFSHGLRGVLVSMDLLDADSPQQKASAQQATAAAAAAAAAGREDGAENDAPSSWFDWVAPLLPVKKFTDEEWEEYKRSQDEMQRKRIEVALEGGLPVMVDRKQQLQPQPQPHHEQER